MPITVTWGNAEQTYTCFKYVGNWTWAEYFESINQGYGLTKDVPYTVNIMLDLTEAKLIPDGIFSTIQSSMRRIGLNQRRGTPSGSPSSPWMRNVQPRSEIAYRHPERHDP